MNKTTEIILHGVNTLSNTVKQTLGTKGRTILFNDENNRTHITKDGVTVARHIMSTDDYENMVITVLREASLKTMKSSGDGTTTTMILAITWSTPIPGGSQLIYLTKRTNSVSII